MCVILWNAGVSEIWLGSISLLFLIQSFRRSYIWTHHTLFFWAIPIIPILIVFIQSGTNFREIIQVILQQLSLMFYMMGSFLLLSSQRSHFLSRSRTLFTASIISAAPFLSELLILIPVLFIVGVFIIGLYPPGESRLIKKPFKRNLIAWSLVILLLYPSLYLFESLREHGQSWSSKVWSQYFNPPQMKGFSSLTELGSLGVSLSSSGDNDLMIQVTSDRSPGYLRGMNYQTYHRGRWLHSLKGVELKPVTNRLDHQIYRFDQQFTFPDYNHSKEVINHRDLRSHIFYHLNDAWVGVLSEKVKFHPSRHLQIDENTEKGYYFSGEKNHNFVTHERDLKIPDELRLTLQSILIEMNSKEKPKTSQELHRWLRLLNQFYSQHFYYSFDVDPSQENDPILDFLVNQRKGFCEYFASASVLLARANGIPARLAKGFASPTQMDDNTWYYFRKNAHAWIEVLDPEKGWINWDPTPSNMLPAIAKHPLHQRLWFQIKAAMQMGRYYFEYGLWKVSIENLRLHIELHFMGYIAGLVSLLLLRGILLKIGYYRRSSRLGPYYSKSSPELLRLQQEIDSQFQKLGHPCPNNRSYLNHLSYLRERPFEKDKLKGIINQVSSYDEKRFRELDF